MNILKNTPCICQEGYTDPNCLSEIDECESLPCVYEQGSCVDRVNAYICECFAGFTGTNCETELNECTDGLSDEHTKCLNGGICEDLRNDFRCTCLAGWTGSTCEIEIDECLSQPCLNSGTCHDFIKVAVLKLKWVLFCT